jgi:hypothetical protein
MKLLKIMKKMYWKKEGSKWKTLLIHLQLKNFVNITQLMYKKGWDERNGGNVSWIIDEDKVSTLS